MWIIAKHPTIGRIGVSAKNCSELCSLICVEPQGCSSNNASVKSAIIESDGITSLVVERMIAIRDGMLEWNRRPQFLCRFCMSNSD